MKKNFNISFLILILILILFTLVSCKQNTVTLTANNMQSKTSASTKETHSAQKNNHPVNSDLTENHKDCTVYPHIEGVEKKGTDKVKFQFNFEGKRIKIATKISTGVLIAAQKSFKGFVVTNGAQASDWRSKFNDAIINDPFLDNFYNLLLDVFRKRKKHLNLTNDRYVDLLVGFVQNIKYDSEKNRDPRFPVETVGDKQGDCDDKSRLLLGLLSREGFDVAAFHFVNENHMAVGIKADALEYKNTGYTYIETTSPSIVGFPFEKNANIQMKTEPVTIKFGKGKKKYTSAHEAVYLRDQKYFLTKSIKKLKTKMNKQNNICAVQSKRVQMASRKVNAAKKQSASHLNNLINAYNAETNEFNDMVTVQKKMAIKINSLVKINNYITQHSEDRYNTYRFVKKHLSKN